MRTRTMRRVTARYHWDRLQVSFWFAPAIMALAAILLVWVVSRLDRLLPNVLFQDSGVVLTGSAAEMRALLVTVAATVLATTGVVFTLLTLPLSTVAAQYGSRLLRLFLGDRTTQIVLGMFVGTFVYNLAAALSLPTVEAGAEGPQLTATIGLLLMLATFGSLILLIQHVSTMLQAPNIAAAAGAELLDVVRADLQAEAQITAGPSGAGAPQPVSRQEGDAHPVRAWRTGYIQTVDPAILLTLASEKDLAIRLLHKPGHFVWRGQVVAHVWPPTHVDAAVDRQIGRTFRVGNQRTPTQDVECAVNQLVEMAVRAMSPAINDPFTAMTCLEYLGEGLALAGQQGEENRRTYDGAGHLRLMGEPVTFGALLAAAFDMLRHASCDNAAVLLQMLNTIDTIGAALQAPAACRLLAHHAGLILAESQAGALIAADRDLIRARAEALQAKLLEVEP